MEKTLNSHDAYRYLWLFWRIIGIHPMKTYRFVYYMYSFIIHLLFAFLFPLLMIVQLFLTPNFTRLINILTITLSTTTATIKEMIICYYSHSHLQQVHVHLRHLDERAKTDSEQRQLLVDAIRFSHRIFWLYSTVYWSALIAFSILGLMRHTLIWDSWLPFDWTASNLAYSLGFLYHMIGSSVQLTQNLTNDTYPPIYLIILVAQVRALQLRISKLGAAAEKQTALETYNALISCIQDHKECLSYFQCIQPVISGTMFVQVLSSGFALCITAVGFMISNRSMIQLISSGMYLSSIIIELLPCCWFANELLAESNQLTTAMFNCAWYQQDRRFRQSLLIFMQCSHKKITILAGNLVPITLQTFLTVIRFAFSMFTILSQMNT